MPVVEAGGHPIPSPHETHEPGGAPTEKPEAVRVRLLGGFSVSVGARVVGGNGWRLRKAAALVKLLALSRGHTLYRERISALLWPDLDRKSAANNLYRALHYARKALDPSDGASRYLAFAGEMLALCPDGPLWVDAVAFEAAAATARRVREPTAYQAAIDLYAGEMLPEDRYEEWVSGRAEALRETYLALLIGLAGLYEERGEREPAIEALRLALAEEPAHDEARRALTRLRDETPAQDPPLSGRPATRQTADSVHNLPDPRTSFVGREREVVGVKRSLAMTGVLTVTGIGGCGKTRLALEVARDLSGAYPDGAWLVELAPLSDPELVPQAVAAALDVFEQPGQPLTKSLAMHLRSTQTLLVLDNCEHVVEACAELVDHLLSSCPRLRVLATSREALGVVGETVWSLSPLALPDGGRGVLPLEELARYDAVRLFLERARSRLPEFEPTEGNIRGIVEVCRKLDGIPLAIELATARLSALAVEQVVARLNDSLQLLTTGARTANPRHQTLRATLRWSHELLDEEERGLFARLSVFAGGWTLEAAEEVCPGEGKNDTLHLLSRLVDKSLVVAQLGAGTASRYRMLEPVRQYAREMLEDAGGTPEVRGEAERVRERHARYYLALAEMVEPELSGARPLPWLELLDTEYGNLRAALSWALDEEADERAEIGLRLATALGRFWDAHGPGEGRRWLEKGLARSGAAPASVRASALNEAGFIAVYEGNPRGMALLEESLALYKEIGDLSGASLAINNLGHAVVHGFDRARMASLRNEVEALLTRPLEKRARANLMVFLGFAAALDTDFGQMRARIEEALALFRELGDVRNLGIHLPILGVVIMMHDTDFEEAAKHFEEGLILQRDLKYKSAIYFGLLGMAGVAALRGQPARTAKLSGAAEALRESIGLVVTPVDNAYYDYDGLLATARTGMSEAAFEALFSEGRTMSTEVAVEYALSTEDTEQQGESSPEPGKARSDGPNGALTRRQSEVAVLVGRGLSNRQIARRLGTGERTVEAHVGKVLKKLGLRSRTQMAAWVANRATEDEDPAP